MLSKHLELINVADVIGTDLRMRDAEERVVGTVQFVLDFKLPDMLHARAVRSPYPHARVINVNIDEALRLPGVIRIVTGADLVNDTGVDPYFGAQKPDQAVLAIDKVRYAGDPVAIVVAETERAAADATPFVDVEYEELPFVVSEVEAAETGAPEVHDGSPDKNVSRWRLQHGDFDTAIEQADHVFSDTYYSPPASHVPMEPMVCVANWNESHLEVWSSVQAPHAVREGLEQMFFLGKGEVRVRTFNVGGAYGSKGQVRIEPMVACASRAVGRPVRMELSREEVFQTIGKHAATVELITGVMEDGTILARRTRVNYNAGAYAVTSVYGAGQGLTRANGPYRIPNVIIETAATYTNTVPNGPHRGAMTTQIAFAYESQLDDIASALGLDPVLVRRKNLLREHDSYPTGEVLQDLHYGEILDDLELGIGWGRNSGRTTPGKVRGKGLAIIIKNTLTPSRSEATLRLSQDEGVQIYSSSVEMGQGSNATLVQIAADSLSIHTDRIVMEFPDTDFTPFDTTTSSSRTTSSMGEAVTKACQDLLGQLIALASTNWDVRAESLCNEDGYVVSRERPELRMSWGEVLREARLSELTGHGVFQSDFGLAFMDPLDVKGPVSVHWHQGGAAAEVEVDLETGHIEVLRMHVNCYAGRVVNPLRVRQQNQGCAIFGLGPTLFEELQYQDGTMSNPNFSDYMIPSVVDVPDNITSTAIESDDPDAELHGVGESVVPAVSPAVGNAVFAATGVRLNTLPFSAESVLRALERRSPTLTTEDR